MVVAPGELALADRWLDGLTSAQQSVVSGLFFAALREGHSEAGALCRFAVVALRLRIANGEGAGLGLPTLERHLCDRTAGALAHARACMAWEATSAPEQVQLREASRVAFRAQLAASYRSKLAAFEQQVGR